MTTAYTPTFTTPRLTELDLVDGDLCDITIGRRYCLETAVSVAVDADSRIRILCAQHTAMYFPSR
jgi:hypothetical protein